MSCARTFVGVTDLFLFVALFQGCSIFGPWQPEHVISYTVKSGDTVTALAQRFNSMNYEILQLNEISDPQRLEPGRVLQIPVREPAKTSVDREYHVQQASLRRIRLTGTKQYVGKLKWPVPGGKLISPFGYRDSRFHEGVDIKAPEGTPIYAAHDGVAVYSNDGLRGYGNLVAIKGDSLMTVYGHNSSNDVSPGDRVQRGQKIAEVGQTGRAQGPHLHFETRVRTDDDHWAAVDPLVFFP